MIRCPVCRAENESGPTCRRCKANLSMLFALEARRDALLLAARAELASGRWAQARAAADEADGLRRDEASLRLVALTALLCRDFPQALRIYAICKGGNAAPAALALPLLALPEPSADALGWLVAVLVLTFPVVYLIGWAHELGHAVCGKLAGFRITACGMGTGRPLAVLRLFGTHYYVARERPLQGIAFALMPQLLPARGRLLLLLAGGILAHALLVLASALLLGLVPWGATLWWGLLLINALFVVVNGIPFTSHAGSTPFRTDGGLMRAVWLDGGIPARPRDMIQQSAGLRGLLADIGDDLHVYVYRLKESAAWLDLGCPDAARESADAADAVPGEVPTWCRAYGALIRAGVCPPDEGERALDEAERLFASESHAAGMFLTRLRRVDLLATRGRAADALALYDELKADPLAAGRPYLLVEIDSQRLCCQTRLPDADLAALRDGHAALGRRHPSAAREFRFARALAAAAEARGETDLARAAYGEALRVAGRLHRDWKEPSTRERFARAQGRLLADARAFYESQGLTADAGSLDSLFVPSGESEKHPFAELEKRNRRHRAVGTWLALGTIAAAGFVTAQLKPGDVDRLPAAVSAAMAMLVAVAAMSCCGLMWLLGLGVPLLRRRGGWVVWLIVLVGWAVGLVSYFAVDWESILRATRSGV